MHHLIRAKILLTDVVFYRMHFVLDEMGRIEIKSTFNTFVIHIRNERITLQMLHNCRYYRLQSTHFTRCTAHHTRYNQFLKKKANWNNT